MKLFTQPRPIAAANERQVPTQSIPSQRADTGQKESVATGYGDCERLSPRLAFRMHKHRRLRRCV